MPALPLPSSVAGDSRGVTPEQAARLEQLAGQRRFAGSSATPPTPDADADRAARLARLAQRQAPPTDPAPAGARPRRRKHHPAKGARVAALGMSLATTAGLAGVFATMSRPAMAESPAVIVSGGSIGSTTAGAAASTAVGSTTPVPSPTVVDGAVFRNKWGSVQVEATFAADGKLTDVTALQTPDDRGQSIRINDAAVPRLTTEALRAQTADVHTVSGATYTSDGYRRSLQSAIDAARSAGVTEIA